MTSRMNGSNGFRLLLVLLLAAFQCTAAGPATPARTKAAGAREAASVGAVRAINLPSSVLDPVNEKKIHVSSTNSNGDCPNGATKLEKCSGVYPNGNSWEIAPCCRTETD